jgi:hypothetical protein
MPNRRIIGRVRPAQVALIRSGTPLAGIGQGQPPPRPTLYPPIPPADRRIRDARTIRPTSAPTRSLQLPIGLPAPSPPEVPRGLAMDARRRTLGKRILGKGMSAWAKTCQWMPTSRGQAETALGTLRWAGRFASFSRIERFFRCTRGSGRGTIRESFGVHDHGQARPFETRPDGGKHVMYTNEIGQIIRLLRQR